MYEMAEKEEPGGVHAYSSKSGAMYPARDMEEEMPTSTCESSSPSLLNNTEDVLLSLRLDDTCCEMEMP